MNFRLAVFLVVLPSAPRVHAQSGTETRYALHAAVFCRDSMEPVSGVLVLVAHPDGQVDSLISDDKGVARTLAQKDTLMLSFASEYSIKVMWPGDGGVQLRDKVVMDALHGSTTFIKEYYIHRCFDPRTQRWKPANIFFPENSSIPRTDSAWYLQEADANGLEEAIGAIVDIMRENPTLILKAQGYCDAGEKDCAHLALARAVHVRELLLGHGVPPERLQAEGRGVYELYSELELANMSATDRATALAQARHVGYLVVGFTDKP